ncbi:uncharacterized protein FOMMEDRAFT_98302 [Fomitiporia mediterranea MF3/22]|uniref:Ubiquitin-like domain-containing protein n=1 Tax=Fomitiporia mediterranea (strain MF3/22) TaxID=694068 RepID=R7SH07_FOMME|nr:uncharacterized protein FOMMEDRAFT_98302 [Fomitiporia mediterranea MF3/22]EJC97690.1 hypothetical protein FOMMEDRAFT_98302 [Fomitiporia mediterranea MF3/22]
MSDSAELAFVKAHLNNIGSLPVQYPDDYQQPPHNSLKKLPIIPVDLPEPPARKVDAEASTSSGTLIYLVFKVTKPARTFNVSVLPTDAISSIKSQLASQPGAPPPDAQRLLLRGKALADNKLLKEYPVKSGDTVNLMLKPGFEWDWDTTAAAVSASPVPKDGDGDTQMSLDPQSQNTGTGNRGRHGRIPSVVLSPSPSPSMKSLPLDNPTSPIPLTLDTSNIPSAAETTILDAYHKRITSPEFWDRLYSFLRSEFPQAGDADQAFEAFLLGSKGSLSPSDIARIRDTIGITGMNGS